MPENFPAYGKSFSVNVPPSKLALMTTLINHKLKFFRQCGYEPSPSQELVHKSSARFRIVAAGARFGKSMLAGAEIANAVLFPNRNIWCVSSQYELAEKEFQWAVHWLSQFKFKGRKLIDFFRLSYAARGSKSLIAPWNSYVKTKSTEKPSTLLGEELDLIVLGESSQVSASVWERFLRPRLGPRNGGIIAPSTPNSDSGLFMEFFETATSGKESDWKAWQFSTLDNPTFSRAEWEKAKLELDPKVFAEQYEGKFISRRGKVFDFQKDAHVVESMPSGSEHWPISISFRPKAHNPFIVLFIVYDKIDQVFYVVDERYVDNPSFAEVARDSTESVRGKRVLFRIADYRNEMAREELKKVGINCTFNDEKKYSREHSEIRRIQLIQSLLKVRDNGHTRIKVLSKCKRLIEDFEKCTWQESKADKDRMEPEMPLDRYLGGPTCLSYLCAYLERARGYDIYSHQIAEDQNK